MSPSVPLGTERQPLLATSPSPLNPLAPTFTFPSPKPPPQSSSSSPRPIELELPPPPTPDEWDARRAHTLSPHTRTHSSNTSDDEDDFSFASITPTRRTFRRVHLFVQFPISILMCVGLAAGLVAWKREVRWPELAFGVTAWLASESLKDAVFDLFQHETVGRDGVPVLGTGLALPTIVHAVLQEFLRLGAIALTVALLPEPTPSSLTAPTGPPPRPPTNGHGGHRRTLPPLDTLFFSALWLALGWALVEILWGSRDFWRRIQLYDDVLDDSEVDEDEFLELEMEADAQDERRNSTVAYGSAVRVHRGSSMGRGEDERATTVGFNGDGRNGETTTDKTLQLLTNSEMECTNEDEDPLEREEMEAETDARIRSIEREEVEAQLGVPLFEIPVAVVIVWRIDSLLLSFVLTLLLALPFRTTSPTLIAFPLWPTVIVGMTLHVFLSLLWVLRIKSVGIPSVSYMTLVILVAALFGVLGAWGALQ